jgi:hypothetical protein
VRVRRGDRHRWFDYPLTFVTSAFVPTSAMPGAVRAFADVKPVTLAVDAARALTVGHAGPGAAGAGDAGVARWSAGRLRAVGGARLSPGRESGRARCARRRMARWV